VDPSYAAERLPVTKGALFLLVLTILSTSPNFRFSKSSLLQVLDLAQRSNGFFPVRDMPGVFEKPTNEVRNQSLLVPTQCKVNTVPALRPHTHFRFAAERFPFSRLKTWISMADLDVIQG
jgi:hypothetical protein